MYNRIIETVEILISFLKDIEKKDWINYIDIKEDEDIKDFLNENILTKDYFNLSIIEKYLNLIKNKLNLNFKVNISFVTENIYWEDIFVINNTIFIKENFYKNITNLIENNNYKKVDDILIINNKYYNKKLINLLTNSFYYINNYYNLDNYLRYNFNKNIIFVNKDNIINLEDLCYFKDPNYYFLNNKIPIYFNNNKFYIKLDLFISKPSFCPYYENNIFEIINFNNKFEIISIK
jgi:hypothetical protein